MRTIMLARCVLMAAILCLAGGCDRDDGLGRDPTVDVAKLKQQCWAGQADACDAYKERTGSELPYAAAAKRADAMQKDAKDGKAKGAEF